MKRMIVVPLVLVVGGMAACGGDDDAISKEEFVAKANAICASGNEQIDQRAEEFFGPKAEKRFASQAEAEEQFGAEVVVPNIQKQVDDVEALGAPDGDEDLIERIIDQAQSGVDQMRADPSLAASEEPVPDLDEAGQKLADYGAKECGA